MGQVRTIGIQVIVNDDDKERINKIIQALREADKDLSLEYTTNSGAVHVRKYAIQNGNSNLDTININARESLKKIVDTLLSMDKHIKFKPLWY